MINIETNGRVAKGSFSHAFWRLLLLRVKSRATWQIWKRRGHCVEVHGSLSRWPPCSSKTQTVRATPRLSVMLIHMQGWLKCRRWIFACCLYNDTQGWSPTSLPGHLLLGWFLCNFFFFPSQILSLLFLGLNAIIPIASRGSRHPVQCEYFPTTITTWKSMYWFKPLSLGCFVMH